MIETTTTDAIKAAPAAGAAVNTAATGAAHTIQKGLGEAGSIIGLPENIDFPVAIAKLIRVGMGFVGIILLVLVLNAGFMWMTAGGDEEKVIKAKKTLINAFIGLFLIFSAYSIASGAINVLLPK